MTTKIFILLTITACLLIAACSFTIPTAKKHGCFRPVPRKYLAELRSNHESIKWPLSYLGGQEFGTFDLNSIKAALRWGLPLVELKIATDRVILTKALKLARGTSSILVLNLDQVLRSELIAIAQQINEVNLESQILFRCPDLTCLETIRAVSSHSAVSVLVDSELQVLEALAFKPDLIELNPDLLSASIVSLIKTQAGRILLAFTKLSSDKESFWREAIAQGVDIVETNRPLAFFKAVGGTSRCN